MSWFIGLSVSWSLIDWHRSPAFLRFRITSRDKNDVRKFDEVFERRRSNALFSIIVFRHKIFLQHFNNGRIESAEVKTLLLRVPIDSIVSLGFVSMFEKILLGAHCRSRSVRSTSSLSFVSTGSTSNFSPEDDQLDCSTRFLQATGLDASTDFFQFMTVFHILERGTAHEKILCEGEKIFVAALQKHFTRMF